MITEEQKIELEEKLKPVVEWLCNNCNPHASLLVDGTGAQLVEGVAGFRILEYIKD